MNELLQPKTLVGDKMRFGHYFNPVFILIRNVVEMTDGPGNTLGYLEDPLTRCGVRVLAEWAISIMSSRSAAESCRRGVTQGDLSTVRPILHVLIELWSVVRLFRVSVSACSRGTDSRLPLRRREEWTGSSSGGSYWMRNCEAFFVEHASRLGSTVDKSSTDGPRVAGSNLQTTSNKFCPDNSTWLSHHLTLGF